MRGTKALVAYLTRSGNTRVIAETLHRQLTADLFEIRPGRPYPDDYELHVAQAARERASGYEPPLAAKVEGIAGYDEFSSAFPFGERPRRRRSARFCGPTTCAARHCVRSSRMGATGSATAWQFSRVMHPVRRSRRLS